MIKFKIQGGYNMNKTPDNTEQNIEENKKEDKIMANFKLPYYMD